MTCYCNSPILETEPRFQCAKCLTVFHQSCVPSSRIIEEIFGDLFYSYLCRSCSSKPDKDDFRRLPMSWLQLAQLSVYHLAEAAHRTDLANGRALTIPRYISLTKDVLPFVERNWPHFSPKQPLPPSWRDSLATTLSMSHEPALFLRDPMTDAFALIDHTPPIPPLIPPSPPPPPRKPVAPPPPPHKLPFAIPPPPPGVNPEAFVAKFMALMSKFGGAAAQGATAQRTGIPARVGVKSEPSSSASVKHQVPSSSKQSSLPAREPTLNPDPLPPPTPPSHREPTPDPLPPRHIAVQNRLKRLRKLQDRKRQLQLPPCVSLDALLLPPPANPTSQVMIEPTPYPSIPYLCPPLPPSSLTRLPFHESIYGRPKPNMPIHSPLTGRALKPYIWHDRTSTSPHMRLLASLGGAPYPISYSPLTARNVAQVNQLLAATFWDGIDVAEYLSYPDFTVVATYGQLVIGCALATPDGYLAYVAVLPGWQGAGVGQFMVYWVAVSIGRDVTLHVSANNPAMIMYQKMGFKPEEFIVGFYDKYYPEDGEQSKHALFVRLRKGAATPRT